MMTQTQSMRLSEQVELLKYCVEKQLDLEDELFKLGRSYDNLQYKHNDLNEHLFSADAIYPMYQTLEDYDFPRHNVPVVSFFSGAGGMDLGFEQAGFEHLASIEINELFCDTLRKNRGRWAVLGPPIHSGDIRNRDEFSHLLRQHLGITPPFDGVFHGGPPCQSFSVAANQRFSRNGDNFKRTGFSHEQYGSLLFDYVWYIQQFRPRAFLIENVAGLMDMDAGGQITEAIQMLESSGYEVTTPTILNAAHYSVPQNRMRVFICGSRTSHKVVLPPKDALLVPCHKALEKPINGLENHITREHKADSILRYMELRYGQRDRLGRVDRLHPYLASKTVIAGGAKGGGRSHLHPQVPRTLSVRECARLQTFPDNYVFCGPSARQFTQVGNAVPPLLAMKIARAIYESAYEGHYTS
jgi:DNA (cytosine-5)-methyltransferase 1